MIYFTGIIIIILIFTNAITDAPNAISTVVGTNVISFRKAAYISSVFNLIGIVVMCFINFSVAENIATIINFNNGKEGIISLLSAMISVIVFALVAMKFGIPTSETHGLIAGLAGSCFAIGNLSNINLEEWSKVLLGLLWSIIGTYMMYKLFDKVLRDFLNRVKKKNIEKFQLLSCCSLSFMHGAQDGLKFIGVLIIYICGIKNIDVSNCLSVNQNFWIIILVSSVMSIGVCIGGRSIVENVGKNITKLNNVDAILTDITTSVSLLFASIFGIPVSTTHSKTVSIIAVGKNLNLKAVFEIIKAWFITFPVCMGISFLITKLLFI